MMSKEALELERKLVLIDVFIDSLSESEETEGIVLALYGWEKELDTIKADLDKLDKIREVVYEEYTNGADKIYKVKQIIEGSESE